MTNPPDLSLRPSQQVDPNDSLKFLRGPDWSNRLALAPMTNRQSNEDGTLHQDELDWLAARADGGFGLVMTCAAHVAAEGQAFPGQLGIWNDRHLPGLARLAASLRDRGAASSIQLHHGGLRASRSLGGTDTVAPWDDERSGARALQTEEIPGLVQQFAVAAARAEAAGFDGVEIHGAHGYLLAQFLDGVRNTRDDGYGGSLEDRSRVLFNVVEAVRATTGPQFQVGVRLSPERYGVRLDESLSIASTLLACGHLDYLDMSLWDVEARSADPAFEGQQLVGLFAALPRHGVRLGVAGKLTSSVSVRWCLDQGADFALIGTGAIVHHDFPRRVLADPTFESAPQPVSREHLRREHVGDRFADYLASEWDDFVL